MKIIREDGNPRDGYQLYAYEFDDNSTYIGITCKPKSRHKNHRIKGPVAEKVKAGYSYTLVEIEPYVPIHKVALEENKAISRYKNDNFLILNKARGGSTGSVRSKHTFERCLSFAHTAGTKVKFLRDHPREFAAASKYKWLRKIEQELGWPTNANQRWTYEICLESARPFKHISDWREVDHQAYDAAHDNKWLARIKQELGFTTKQRDPMWTYDACLNRARNFSTRTDWQYNCHDGSYVTARKNGWLNTIAGSVFGPRRNRWSHVNEGQ